MPCRILKEKKKREEERGEIKEMEGGGGFVTKVRPSCSCVCVFSSLISQSSKVVHSSKFFPSLLHISRHTRPHWVSNP